MNHAFNQSHSESHQNPVCSHKVLEPDATRCFSPGDVTRLLLLLAQTPEQLQVLRVPHAHPRAEDLCGHVVLIDHSFCS